MSEYGERGYTSEEVKQPEVESTVQQGMTPEQTAELDKEYIAQVRRKSFRDKMVASFGLALAVGIGFAGTLRYFSEENQENQEMEAKEKTDLERYNEYLEKLGADLKTISQAIKAENLSASENKIAKNEAATVFLLEKENSAQLKEMMDLAVSGTDPKILVGKLFRILSEAGAQDFFYDHLAEGGKYKGLINPDGSMEKSIIYNDLREYHFATLAKNFLPNSSEISDEEIDPRLFSKSVEEVEQNIIDEPEWSGVEKQAEFKKVLDDKDVRGVLESPDFVIDLAQAYSLIKISIDSKNRGDERNNAEIIKDLLEKQEDFFDVSILSKETENFIFVAGHDIRLNDDISRFASRYQKIGEDFGVKNISGFSGAEGMEESFKKSVAESKGPTTLLIDAHSNAILFQLNNNESITVQEFAKALLERSKAGESLAEISIVLGGCETYGLAENLIKEIDRQAKKDKKLKKLEIMYPNIITAVTGSAKAEQGVFRDALSETVKGVGGSLTGDDIVNILSTKVYGKGADISVFKGGKGSGERVSEVETTYDSSIG